MAALTLALDAYQAHEAIEDAKRFLESETFKALSDVSQKFILDGGLLDIAVSLNSTAIGAGNFAIRCEIVKLLTAAITAFECDGFGRHKHSLLIDDIKNIAEEM